MRNKILAAVSLTLINGGTQILTIEGLTVGQKVAVQIVVALGSGMGLLFQPPTRWLRGKEPPSE
jgi:hypothetical protein